MRAREFVRESLDADQVLDYVKRTHAPDEFNIEYSITDHPEWELKTIPLSQLNLDPDGEARDPYNRVNWVDDDKVQELIPRIGSVLKSNPIVVDTEGWIIDGNHRAMAAAEAGMTSVPALVPVKQDMAENMSHSQDGRAVEELKSALLDKRDQLQSATDDQVYDIIDKIMTRIARSHSISGQKLHDMWVDRYKQIPDTWIMNKEQGMAEDVENFNGIDVAMEIEGDEIMVRATAGGRELGHVLFVEEGEYLMPQDLEVDERFQGQGIAAAMYDYVKSKGYRIRRSGQQTDAGAGFWGKHRPEQNVWEQGVAEGLSQNQGQVRQTLNAWMNQDQQYEDPTQRAGFQAKVWPYIQKNIQSILSDKGEKGNGDYPAAPYAAWLLVQHMDAYPQNQIEFYNALKQAIPNHPKIQFLRDRAAVNQWIMKNANNPEYFIKGKALPNPTVNVRNPAMFKDAGIVATSREEALANAEQAGNKLLVAAVNATNAQTQPSYKQSANENFADGRNPGRKGLAKRSGVNTKASVSTLRNVAKHSTGEKQRMAHWLANMKAGRAKARKK